MRTELDAVQVLKKDKHTMLEGYITEDIFEKQWLRGREYSRNWWFAQSKAKKKYFFIIKDKINKLDVEIALKLSCECWQVTRKDGVWHFKNNQTTLTLEEFLKQENIAVYRDSLRVNNELKNQDRQKACIDYFVKNGIAEEVAKERMFANQILTVYFPIMTNIDGFVKRNDGEIVVTEIKFKYESYSGHFGFNIGQANVLRYFKEHGFVAKAYVLYNSTKSKDVSILDFLKNPVEKYWLTTNGELDLNEIATAPDYTSLTGRKTQRYYMIKKEMFNKGFMLKIA